MLSIKISNETLNRIISDYKNNLIYKNIGNLEYVFVKDKDLISIYKCRNKNFYKALFQGPNSYDLIDKYNDENIVLPKKNRFFINDPIFIDINSQIGNFDIGSNELFGPICFCSSYIDEETMRLFESLKINNISKLKDDELKKIVPNLRKKVFFEFKILDSNKINSALNNNFSLNKIKTVIYDNLIQKMFLKFPYTFNVYFNNFSTKDEYLSFIKTEIKDLNSLVFNNNNSLEFPSIELSYCIARFLYLKSIEEINKKYNVLIPSVNSSKIKLFSLTFIKKFGIDEFNKITKKTSPLYFEIINEYNNNKN